MKKINEEIKSLVLHIQGLVIETPNIIMNYQAEIYSLSIYSFGENGKYQYHKRVYIDGLLSTEKAIIAELKQIINDLKEIRNYEYSSKNKLIS
jgi:hypothetical protein